MTRGLLYNNRTERRMVCDRFRLLESELDEAEVELQAEEWLDRNGFGPDQRERLKQELIHAFVESMGAVG